MINWIKTHKLTVLLLVFIIYFIFRSVFGVDILSFDSPSRNSYVGGGGGVNGVTLSAPSSSGGGYSKFSMPSFAGLSSSVSREDRVVVQESSLSLLVKDVRETGDRIIKFAEDRGGFMVDTSYTRPEESPFGTITVRVPTNILNDALSYFRSQGIKVTSENIRGRDVTDQYVNIENRIDALLKIKARYESLTENSGNVSELLSLQREIGNTQTQIDNFVGQKKALEENAKFTKITVFLSTDELSLPYAPDNKFRPNVVFKLAVRSMLNTLVWLGQLSIWVGVYSVIWVPALILFIVYKKWQARRKSRPIPRNT